MSWDVRRRDPPTVVRIVAAVVAIGGVVEVFAGAGAMAAGSFGGPFAPLAVAVGLARIALLYGLWTFASWAPRLAVGVVAVELLVALASRPLPGGDVLPPVPVAVAVVAVLVVYGDRFGR